MLFSRWHLPSLGRTIPPSLPSPAKWKPASVENTSRRVTFLQPICSWGKPQKNHFAQVYLGPLSCRFGLEAYNPSYLADRNLHDGIEASLRRVQVPWDLLLTDQPIELLTIVSQFENVLVAEGACAVLVSCAGVDEPGWCGADVRHHCLLYKGAKS